MNKQKGAKKIMIVAVSILIVLTAVILFLLGVTFNAKLSVESDVITKIYVDRNMKFRDFVKQMHEEGIVEDTKILSVTGYFLGLKSDVSVKPGCYPVYPDMTAMQLLQRVKRGEQVPVKLTINHMRLPEQFAAKISSQMMIDSAEVMNFITDKDKMNDLGFKPEHLFVLVVRNTYEVWWTASVEDLMNRLKKEHEAFWNSNNRLEKADDLGLSKIEAVTLASIVEEETNYQPEKSRVAGLYINRLRKGIRLQSDPTVKFALKDFKMNRILFEHLKVDNPYNTYKYAGLPPGPIKLPSVASIDATLNAEKHNYIFMCANENFNGTHNFATNLSEHNANAARYHVALKKWLKEKEEKEKLNK